MNDQPEKFQKHKRNKSEDVESVKLQLKNIKTLFFFVFNLREN